ncbi:hypothetical protein SAMN05216187_108127 [Jeotgalicoccus aerolatus]|uniref:Phage protein n=1 Tax=Jeotgalicoccus aerolatus TaxID=709510 RepID=A0A1G9BW25_9STAP|nr:hypothetical protein [Jeotgalicoccus aerolatus]SDK43583.1 hypothetical protein SAMN05216187_108127 [Jeotgalicoccus aerolatus]
MAIELKLKRDGKHVTLKRPNTNVLELEEFEDFQDELGDIQGEYFDELQKDKTKAVSFFPYRKRIRNRQIEYIKELFEDHDAFSVEEFKTGIDSEKLDDVIVGIFKQISPSDYKEDKPEGKKKA